VLAVACFGSPSDSRADGLGTTGPEPARRRLVSNFLDLLRSPVRYTTDTRELHVSCGVGRQQKLRAMLETAIAGACPPGSVEVWEVVSALAGETARAEPARPTRVRSEVTQIPQGAWFVQRGGRPGDPYLVAGRTGRHWFHYTSDWEQLDLFWPEFGVSASLVESLVEPLPTLERDLRRMAFEVEPPYLRAGTPETVTIREAGDRGRKGRVVARMVVRSAHPELALPLMCAIGEPDAADAILMYSIWSYRGDPLEGGLPFPGESCNVVLDVSGIQLIWNEVSNLRTSPAPEPVPRFPPTVKVFSYAHGLQLGGIWLGSGLDRVPGDVRDLFSIESPGRPRSRVAHIAAASPDSGRGGRSGIAWASRAAGAGGLIWLVVLLKSRSGAGRSASRGGHTGSGAGPRDRRQRCDPV
jgi:hypothetical protein